MAPLPRAAATAAAPSSSSASAPYDVDEHLLSVSEVAHRYGTHVDAAHPDASRGLSEDDVPSLRAKHGRNAMTPPHRTPELIKVLRQFANPLLLMLALAMVLTFMVYGVQQTQGSSSSGSGANADNLILACVMLLVVVVLALTSYWQERSAGNVMATLKQMMPSKCTVIRDGAEHSVDAADLVPGDLVRLRIGDRVPADLRVVGSHSLKVEMSSLTGESDLVPAGVERVSNEALEARNLLFAGCLVMQGGCRAVVVRTGDRTMIGRIAALASGGRGGGNDEDDDDGGDGNGCVARIGCINRSRGKKGANRTPKTTLDQELDRLIRFVAVVATVVPCALFAIGAARRRLTPLDAFINGFVLAVVACVLQGLRATTLSLLSLCSTKLRQRQVLAKRMSIIEQLGCCTMICSDKTGTLTQNVMTVQSVWVGGRGTRRHSADDAVAALVNSGQQATISEGALAALVAPPHEASSSLSAAAAGAYSWSGCSTLQRLVVMAAVCNAAQYAGAEGGGQAAAPPTPVPDGAVAVQLLSPVPETDAPEPSKLEVGPAKEGATADDNKNRNSNQQQQQLLGDATDCGLLRFADRSLPSALVRARYKKIYELPFNSTDKFALVVVEEEQQSVGGAAAAAPPGQQPPPRHLLFLKGAPEIVATKCGRFCSAVSGREQPVDEAFEHEMAGAYRGAGGNGERVIGFAYAPLDLLAAAAAQAAAARSRLGTPSPTPPSPLLLTTPTLEQVRAAAAAAVDDLLLADAASNRPPPLCFLGLATLMDPPRPGVKEAVAVCRTAGIRVAMVTGDHPLTAEAIARQVGIVTKPAVRGTEVAALRKPAAAVADAPGRRLMELNRRAAALAAGGGGGGGALPTSSSPPALPPPLPEKVAARLRDIKRDSYGAGSDKSLGKTSVGGKSGLPPLQRTSPLLFQPPAVVAEHGATALVVTGAELRELDRLAAEGKITPAEHEARWDGILAKDELVFARVSPDQKLQLVDRLQQSFGEVVAMTGDGVNDAPALKHAAIGVAMGKGGSDVARDAADIILIDDDFCSIVGACEEGRVVFDNLRKSIAFATAKVLSEVLPLFLLVALDMPLGMSGLLILTIDLLTDQPPAISLAYEPGESATMQRPPRNRATERLIGPVLLFHSYITVGSVMAAACLLSYFVAFWSNGVPLPALWGTGASHWQRGAPPLEVCWDPSSSSSSSCRSLSGDEQYRIVKEAHSAWYATLILSQAVHIFCAKTRVVSIFKHGVLRNRATPLGLLVSFTIAAIVMFAPKVQDVFGALPPPGLCWVPWVGFAVWVVAYTEGIKWRARKAPNGCVARRLVW